MKTYRIGLVFRLIIILFKLPQFLQGAEDLAIVAIELNSENKGEFVVATREVSDFLIGAEDLKTIGFRNPQGNSVTIESKNYLSLKSMPGVSFEFDESRLTIRIKADPALLKRIELNFAGGRRENLIYPRDKSLIFNYGLQQDVAQSTGFSSFTATQEAGMRIGDYLLASNSIFTRSQNQNHATRLMTNITRDDRTSLTRTVIGDVYAASGNLGSMLMLGGFSYSKSYSIEPSFMKHPTLDYTGFLALPSQVDVYLDGVQIRSEKLSPGEFGLKNIGADGGLHGLEIRIRDALGREQTLDFPFYSSEVLLQKGLHDYSYNAGVLRNDYGMKSNSYSGLAFSAFHRYGVASNMTAGFRAEGGGRLINGGPQLIFSLSRYGVLDAGVSINAGRKMQKGLAASLSHTYLGNQISLRFQAMAYSRNYRTLSDAQIDDRLDPPQFLFEAGFGYGSKRLGSISLDVSGLHKYSGTNRDSYSITYSRALKREIAFSVTYQHARYDKPANQIFATLTHYLHKEATVSATYQHENDSETEIIQVQKNPPAGEGVSYRALIQRFDSAGQNTTFVNPYFQINGRYGIFSAEYRNRFTDDQSSSESFKVSAAGSLVYASGAWGLSRPVNDSFAIIETSSIGDVHVYHNNHEIGATNDTGKIVIPILNSYVDNLLAINDQDIPVNYTLQDVAQRLSPAWRSGVLVRFNATKTQAFSGRLFLKSGDGEQPVEFAEITLMVNNEALKFTTGRDGEFYLENTPPGQFRANLRLNNNAYSFVLKIPASQEMLVDLGKVAIGSGN
jgi:outer membrane usher protein